MIRKLITSMFVVAALSCVQPLDAAELSDPFDAREFTAAEIRVMQASLAFTGYYNGLFDGGWGARSQSALEGFVADRSGGQARMRHAARLAVRFQRMQIRDGWQMRYDPTFGVSVLYPLVGVVKVEDEDGLETWHHRDSSLKITLLRSDGRRVERIHARALDAHADSEAPYVVRRNNLWVSSSRAQGGTLRYFRSDVIGGSWSSVLLTVRAEDADLLRAVAGSISVGEAARLAIPPNGSLEALAATLLARRDNDTFVPRVIGTATKVGTDRHYVTATQLVADCRRLATQQSALDVVAQSNLFGLTLLEARRPGRAPVPFSGASLLSGDVVTLAGHLPDRRAITVSRNRILAMTGPGENPLFLTLGASNQENRAGEAILTADGRLAGILLDRRPNGHRWNSPLKVVHPLG